MPENLEESAEGRVDWNFWSWVLGLAATLQLPIKWIWRTVEKLGDIDFVVTHAHDPGWIGMLLRMFSDVVHGPEIIVFILGVGWLAYLYHRSASLLKVASLRELESVSPSVSPHDEAIRGKITVLFRAYGDPASRELKSIGHELLSQFRNFRVGDNWPEGHRIMAQLVDDGPYMVWSRADDRLRGATDGRDEVDGVGLQHLLGEFFLAYQNLVRWVNRLDNFQVRFVAESMERKERVTRFRSVLEGKDFISWQEKHKLFHQQFREMLAVDDFAKLRARVDKSWSDTFPPPMKV